MVVYLFHMFRFFMKTRNLQIRSIENRPSVEFVPKSFIPEIYKIGLIKSLLFWYFSLCSDFIKFHHGSDKLKSILYKNSYPHDLVNKYIKEFLEKNTGTKNYNQIILGKWLCAYMEGHLCLRKMHLDNPERQVTVEYPLIGSCF